MLWNILFGLVLLGTNKYGDYITDKCPQAGYACPDICDVDHKHLPLKECKDAKEKKSRRSKESLQASEQLDEETVGVHKSEGL